MTGEQVGPSAGGWSRVVHSYEEARRALADPEGELDLRAPASLDATWGELGFVELVPGELVRPVEVALESVEQTQALGARLATSLHPGDLVVLTGQLGAGKTALTQGLGAGLGVRGAVTSPTFVLARRHPGPLPLLHVDVYRLRGGQNRIDLDDLGLDDEMPTAVTVVEWGEGVVEGLSPSRLHIVLTRPDPTEGTPDGRSARVQAVGPRWAVLTRT